MKTMITLTVLNTLISAITFMNVSIEAQGLHQAMFKINQTVNTIAIFGNDTTWRMWKMNN